MTPEEVRQLIREELQELLASDRYIFSRTIQIMDGRNIQLGRTTGTKIGTSSTQKLGFFGATPVVQQASIADPSGGVSADGAARDAINSILDVLDAYGLTA